MLLAKAGSAPLFVGAADAAVPFFVLELLLLVLPAAGTPSAVALYVATKGTVLMTGCVKRVVLVYG